MNKNGENFLIYGTASWKLASHHTKDCPDADDSGIRVRTRVIHVLQLVAAAKYLPNSIMVPQHQA